MFINNFSALKYAVHFCQRFLKRLDLPKIDNFKRILGYGVISNFFFAALINMSMVIGILPVVGLPLPLVSYGGSSMLTYFIGFGLILSLKISLDSKY